MRGCIPQELSSLMGRHLWLWQVRHWRALLCTLTGMWAGSQSRGRHRCQRSSGSIRRSMGWNQCLICLLQLLPMEVLMGAQLLHLVLKVAPPVTLLLVDSYMGVSVIFSFFCMFVFGWVWNVATLQRILPDCIYTYHFLTSLIMFLNTFGGLFSLDCNVMICCSKWDKSMGWQNW